MTLFVVVVVGPFLKFLISSFLHSLLLPILSPLVPFDHRSFLLPVPFPIVKAFVSRFVEERIEFFEMLLVHESRK